MTDFNGASLSRVLNSRTFIDGHFRQLLILILSPPKLLKCPVLGIPVGQKCQKKIFKAFVATVANLKSDKNLPKFGQEGVNKPALATVSDEPAGQQPVFVFRGFISV